MKSILEVLLPSFYTAIYVVGIALWAIIISDVLQVEQIVSELTSDNIFIIYHNTLSD